jgi:hypothetical protein
MNQSPNRRWIRLLEANKDETLSPQKSQLLDWHLLSMEWMLVKNLSERRMTMSSNLPPNMAVRAAVEGEVLVVHRFHNGFKGLSSPNHQDALEVESQIFTLSPDGNSIESADECAVCIPDGAEVVMTGISSAFQSRYGVSATEVVIFRQISEGDDTQLDAVDFRNNVIIPLQELELDQRIGVLTLSKTESIIPRETLNNSISL